MKYKLSMAAIAALAAILASPAAAQSVNGTVNVHGTVAARCGTSFTGDTTFNGTINLGELAHSDGTISPALSGSGTNSPAGLADFFVACSGASFNVTLSASRLTNPLFPSVAPGSSIIDYTAEVKITLAEGGFALVDYTTAAALPAPTVYLVNGFVSATPGNFQVRVFGLHPDNGDLSALVAGSYDSVITIQVAPAP